MKCHIFLLPLLLATVSGCSSINRVLSFDDPAPAPQQAEPSPVAPPVAQTDASEQFCRRVSASSRADAAAGGFDAATQDRIALQNYQQCLAIGAPG